jgi:hypothetical protein
MRLWHSPAADEVFEASVLYNRYILKSCFLENVQGITLPETPCSPRFSSWMAAAKSSSENWDMV